MAVVVGIVIAVVPWLRLPERELPVGTEALATLPPWFSEPIHPLPLVVPADAAKAQLGERLFSDPILSRNEDMSCITCHPLDTGGVDGLPTALGMDGVVLDRNTPTVFNSGLNPVQFWDGRADSLEAQVDGPLLSPREMGSNWPQIVTRLRAKNVYVTAFAKLYPGGITPNNVKHAIAEFERTLITPNGRFDHYLRGDESAISDEERQGYQAFKDYGCSACHQGQNVGGNLFQTSGLFRSNRKAHTGHWHDHEYRRTISPQTGPEMIHRVPSLRNVALTAPYFHDGGVPTLKDAVIEMAEHQLGRAIPERDIDLIVKFLHTLTGEWNGRPL